MSIVKDKYQQLKPELRYLADEAILAQAWKKSHSYIRSHNWYADTLELDSSAVNLEKRIMDWAKQLQDGTYSPSEMRLVPAPKTDHWSFYRNEAMPSGWSWGPKSKFEADCFSDKKMKELRPLAHLNIQDQTVATAIMLCLADAVETAQGCTDPDYSHEGGKTKSNRVWSYGNRLFCDWEGDRAKFRWGNSSTYSKYFQDYQRFLERPMRTAQEKQGWLAPDKNIYEIHLDLESFFDSIDRNLLVRKLKKLAQSFYRVEKDQNIEFWALVRKTIHGWRWAEQDNQLSFCLKNGELSSDIGIPQGLVASGFFANAYLIDVDLEICKLINQENEITLIDYCRYVDDMRLLVCAPECIEPRQLNSWVRRYVEPIFETIGLRLNLSKTKIERFTAKRSGVSIRMKAIQQAASGPQDTTALDEMLNSLEGLFSLAEQFRDQEEVPYKDCEIPLSRVDIPQMDVREDTLLRFAANRITKALSEKRLLTDHDNTGEGLNELDHVYESIARRFIAVWSRNPALVSILKKGLCLFPHPHLLYPVLDALLGKIKTRIEHNGLGHEQRISHYCLAEIFRFAAMELHRQRPDQRPKHADWDGFRNMLSHEAKSLLEDKELPWYLQQQITLFFAINEESVCVPQLGEDNHYRQLHCIICGNHGFGTAGRPDKLVPLFIVAYQICKEGSKVISNLGNWLDLLHRKKRETSLSKILSEIAVNNPELFEKVLQYSHQIQAKWRHEAEVICNRYGFDHKALPGELKEYNNKLVSLASVVKMKDNPFAHENALLALANVMLSYIENEKRNTDGELVLLSPHHFKIQCKNWLQIQCAGPLKIGMKLELADGSTNDFRYEPPTSWLSDDEDSKNLYRLGCFLRACAVGSTDFTTGQFLMREDTGHAYWGLKSSWYKRRMGMAHQPEALNGDAAPMSSWVSELLYRLLQWPGLEFRLVSDRWPSRLTVTVVKKLIKDRLKFQAALYGRASKVPVYIEQISHDLKDDRELQVVMVQSLLPKKNDFEKEDPLFNRASFRARHRGHTATMARLVCEKLYAMKQAEGVEIKKPLADLIIFPELSVHPDDLSLLRRLADKTGAMIFTGLTYQLRDGCLTNSALWLIPYSDGRGRQWIERLQGKKHPTPGELNFNVKPWRPYQLVIELANTLHGQPNGFRLTGAICYDATDISLAADLKDISNAFIVSALNQDTDTFDTMVDALHYHMYQPVVLVNTGEFGGSAAKAPYKEKYNKRIAHVHGSNQIAISMFKLNLYDFGKVLATLGSGKEKKTEPAGLKRTK